MATNRRAEPPAGAAGRRQLGDEELMQLIAGGDPRAFEVIYERHCTAAFSLAYRICGVRSMRRGGDPGGVSRDLAQRRAL